MKENYSVKPLVSIYLIFFHSSKQKYRRTRCTKFLISLIWVLWSIPMMAQLPTSFEKVELATGLTNTTTMNFSPDGRIFILDRYGEVNIYKPNLLSVVSAGTLEVFHELEDGLLGIAFDPNFSSNNFIYLYYSPLNFTGNRVSRFTMNGDVLDVGSEVILLQWATSRTAKYHSGGDMSFDSQGNLYIATGDNSTYPDLYTAINESNSDESAEKSSSNANDLRGKILRITPLSDGTYAIPSGNLFPVGTINTRPEIFVMGARNPYRIFVDKENTDWLFWGEVGPDAASASVKGPAGLDEINLTKEAGNYGWPYFSGADNDAYQIPYAPEPQPYYYDPSSPRNISTWNTGITDLPPAQPAWIEMDNRCWLAGPRYYYQSGLPDQQRLPVEFDEAFFYYDFNTSHVWVATMDTDGNLLSNQRLAPSVFPTGSFGFIDMKIGPDGHLYILEYGTGCCDSNNLGSGRLVRIDYTGINNNSSPNVIASADPTNGPLPLAVNFSSAGTTDPNGDSPLLYEWDFDGNGTVDSNEPNPSFTYTVAGTFNAQLRVDDGNGGVGVKNITIYAGNTVTDINFVSPPDGGMINWGDDISLEVTANDAEDGAIPCEDINVIPSQGHENHFHDGVTIDGCSQIYTLAYGGHDIYGDMDIFYVLGANYTDQGGLISFDQVRLHPKRKEAEFFDSESNVTVISNTDPWEGGDHAIRVDHDGFIVFEGRNLINITGVRYKVSASLGGGSIELRVGSPSGNLLSTTMVPSTGGTNYWTIVESAITDPGGKNDLYFVFKGSPGQQQIFDLNYVEFLGAGVGVDAIAPEVNEVEAVNNSLLSVEFSEPLDPASAENLGNYSIDNGINISEISLQPDNRTVYLVTSPMALGVSYNISISNITDLGGQAIETDSYPFGINCDPAVTPFPLDWDVIELEETELPFRSVYIFPHHDLDGDGLKDIVTGAWWYKNPGFASGNWVRSEIGSPFNNVAHVYDFDGDGDFDLLGTEGAYESAELVWAANDGNGNFTVYDNIPAGNTDYREPFLAGLAGGFIEGGTQYQMAINWNGAESTGSPVQLLTVPADPVNTPWTLEDLSPDSLGEEINAGDIDGDGDLDLFQGPVWLRNEGNGNWTTFSTGISYVTTPDRSKLADFDQDGDLDAVVGQLSADSSNPARFEFSWFEAPDDPTQLWTRNVLATDITGSLSVYVADMDFDGDMDIIVGEWLDNHELIIFENDLCDSGDWIRQTIDNGGPIDHHDGAQVVDIDNDGDLDVVSTGWDTIIPRIFINNAIFSSSNLAPVVTNPTNQEYALGAQVSLQINADDPNPGDVLTYSATGLPENLSINSSTGLISGTLNVAMGDYSVDVRATDPGGLFDEESFLISVTDQPTAIRVNSGGSGFNFNGNNWSSDQFFLGGTTFSNNIDIANTANDQLYQTERFSSSGTLTYQIPVVDGNYNLSLHFAELYYGVPGPGESGGEGSRMFNISIENGQFQISDYDIIVAAGGPATAVIESFNDILVNDGNLTITLTGVVENPKISGIEITALEGPVANAGPDQDILLPTNSILLEGNGDAGSAGTIVSYEWIQVSGPAAATLMGFNTENLSVSNLVEGVYVFRLTVTDDTSATDSDEVVVNVITQPDEIRINAGGPNLNLGGDDWMLDTYFTGGTTFTNPIAIENTTNDELYQSERYSTSGALTYEIPVTPGNYDINLHFAELFYGVTGSQGEDGGAGSRVFHITVENSQPQIQNYDIFVAAGGSATAVIESFTGIPVTDGSLTITFTAVQENPKISAIEVFAVGGPIANAGPDQEIILPTSFLTLDGDGFDPNGGAITSYEWTQLTGPNSAILEGTNSEDLNVSGLVEGKYEFRLTVTNDMDATGFDEVVVNVIQQPEILRINSGGPGFVFNEELWIADRHFINGGTFSSLMEIANTDNDQLYQSERYKTSNSLIYEIPVSPGNYDVVLHFAELFFGVPGPGESGGEGSRIFSISIENGQQEISNYDIIAQAGSAATAISERFDGISVGDGSLTISLTGVVENPKISGLEIYADLAATQPPVASAGDDQELLLPQDNTTLNGTGTDPDGGVIETFQWSQQQGPNAAILVGDDTANLSISGLVAGSYIFRLTVTDNEGETGFDEVIISVVEQPGPTAVAEAIPQSGDAPLEVSFTGSNSEDDGEIVSYFWDFQEGGTSTEANPVYVFNTPGDFEVELTVTDDNGATDTVTISISVTGSANQAPVAIAEATPQSGNTPLEVTFTGSNSTDDNAIVSYLWDFGDGGSSSEADPVYIFTADGTYNVTLTVSDAEGSEDSTSISIVVGDSENLPPLAVIEATPTTGTFPLEVSFVGSNSTDDFGILSYSWNFGDGNTSEEADPVHIYQNPGEYTVSLTVSDASGLSNTSTIIISVNETDGGMIAILLENPANDGVARIRVLNQPSDIIVFGLYIHDYSGRLISTYNAQPIYDSNNWYEIPVDTLRDGLYYVTVVFNSAKSQALKLFVKN